MLVHLKKIIDKSIKNNYAIGAFNIHSIETIKGIAEDDKKSKSPAIIQTSEGTLKYMGVKSLFCLVNEITDAIAPNIPFVIHLDHGHDIGLIFDCIDAGFKSVHIDASSFLLEDNIAQTKKVVKYAHKKGVWVQAEIGEIKGGHGKTLGKIGKVPLADPKDVQFFIKETKIDTVAAAVGTAHGAFDDENISFDLLKQIKSVIKIPFVLHGGSGVKDNDIRKAIRCGVSVINIGTDLRVGFCQAVIANTMKNKKETDPRILLSPAVQSVQKIVEQKMKLFGSKNQI
ncbi:MAG: class II fructose-bisphosphate aldolase [Candidatus Falkowbacteria bacterium]|nr:class II fructose-bisphosphate aldolase [Candidatus Falkowbacteria bacterium]